MDPKWTPEYCEQRAQECFRSEQESFDRCDTDGFASQACLSLQGRLWQKRAEIARNGGKAPFQVLLDVASGEMIDARLIEGRYGPVWILAPDEQDRYGRTFVPHGNNSRVQRELGLIESTLMLPAYARIGGEGKGFSGLATAFIQVCREE